MLTSFSIIFISGISFSYLAKKLHLPSLVGMIIAGIIIGPYAFNLLDSSILNLSSMLRQIALIIIITRAGLKLDIKDLKAIGRPAILLCFVPACFEIIGCVIIIPLLFSATILEALIIGCTIAAVSPAIIVPRMIYLINHHYGEDKKIPHMILAGASVDDIVVLVLFTIFTSMEATNTMNINAFLQLPISIILGIIIGGVCGYLFLKLFQLIKVNNIIKTILFLSISFLLFELQNYLWFSALLSIMSMSIFICSRNISISKELSFTYDKLWVVAEIILFVLVGSCVNIAYAIKFGAFAIIVIVFALCLRMIGTFISILNTPLNKKEKLFVMISYTPKATVQAAIGATPLMMGLNCGELCLTIAVLSILISAPLGATLIDCTYKKLL